MSSIIFLLNRRNWNTTKWLDKTPAYLKYRPGFSEYQSIAQATTNIVPNCLAVCSEHANITAYILYVK